MLLLLLLSFLISLARSLDLYIASIATPGISILDGIDFRLNRISPRIERRLFGFATVVLFVFHLLSNE